MTKDAVHPHGGPKDASLSLITAIKRLKVHDHLCLIYENREEQFAAAIPFMRIGLERGEKCIYIADDNDAEEVIKAMRAEGIDVDAVIQSGALAVISKQEAYLQQGFFDPDWMIGFLKQATDQARAEGFSALRVTGEMTWTLGGDPGSERLMEYESKLNYYFPDNEALAICQYNMNRFAPETLRGVIQTHPIVIYGNHIYQNFYFVPPDEFLGRTDSGTDIVRLLKNLADRQRVEDRLRASRDLIESIVEHAPIRVFWKDKDLRYLGCNSLFARDAGFDKPKDLIGKDDFDMPWKDQAESYRVDDAAVMESGMARLSYEEEQTTPDGKMRWLRTSKVPLYGANQEVFGVLGIYDDITGRKQYEQQVKQSESRYRALFQLNPLMCFNLDAEGVITAVNQQGASQLGYTVEELTGRPVTVLFPEELHEKVHAQLQACLGEPGHVFSWEITKIRKDGSTLWVNETASAIATGEDGQKPSLLIICEDITERKQAHERLEASEARNRMLFQSVADYALVLEIRDNEPPLIVDANDAAFDKHGYTRDEMIGQPITMLDNSIDPEEMREIMRKTGAGELVRFESRHRCKDGSEFDIEVASRRIDYEGRPMLYAVERDITKRKTAEEQLHAHIQELERFQQATVDREFRIKELRDEIAALKARLKESGDATD